jgi:hypothetical protein
MEARRLTVWRTGDCVGVRIVRSEIIKSRLEELPEDLKKEVLDYIEFLLQKYGGKTGKKRFRFDWEGGLSNLRDRYTSVELQHRALEWR